MPRLWSSGPRRTHIHARDPPSILGASHNIRRTPRYARACESRLGRRRAFLQAIPYATEGFSECLQGGTGCARRILSAASSLLRVGAREAERDESPESKSYRSPATARGTAVQTSGSPRGTQPSRAQRSDNTGASYASTATNRDCTCPNSSEQSVFQRGRES